MEVNRERKNIQVRRKKSVGVYPILKQVQERVGRTLTALEKRWTELVSSVLQIEMANVALEAEIAQLDKKVEELSAAI